ncbi:MAG: serine/threonine-protein kinase [Ignavibacteriaceae bacterium]
MDSDQWQKIGIIFEEALKLDEPERTEFLLDACGNDSELLAEVRSLIDADTNVPSVLKGQASDAINIPPRKNYEGTIIGSYKIISQIAEGGMGSVFLAERADGQFEQKVALKLIKPGMNSSEIIKRFQFERQILARLQHPNIARLLDGGLTEENLPYFTMDYVEGENIYEYCNKNNLSINERLKLFSKVCNAIQYAHQNLVIHRDLKPSNIIVKKDGTVKLLDFGIAKVFTEDDSFEQSALTRTGLFVMTPEYASPEQIRGEAITTSTDIYSLGLILYQLITGEKAYEIKTQSPLELEKIICFTEPAKPSSAIKSLQLKDKIKAEKISRAHKTGIDKLIKTLSGDLDNICLTALRKEQERRYSSAEQFQQDIENYLYGRPVSARQNTIYYRTNKFIVRHKIAVISAFSIFLIGAMLTTFYFIQLKKERDKAQNEAQKAEQVSEFLKNIFKLSDPYEARGETITARELLDKGAQKIDQELSGQPDVKATMLSLIGGVYTNLGLFDKSEILLKKALDIRNKFNSNSMEEAKSLRDLGQLYTYKGEYSKADTLLTKALNIYKNNSLKEDNNYGWIIGNLAWVYKSTGNYSKSESYYKKAIEVLKKNKDNNEELLTMMNNFALELHEEGNYDDAEKMFDETLRLQKKLYGDKPHPEISTTTYNLAELLRDRGKYDEAEKMFKTSLSMDTQLSGPENPDVAYSLQGLASVYKIKGDFNEAKKLFVNVLNMRKKFLGDNHPDVAYAISNIGLLYFAEEKYDSSKKYYERALLLHKKLNGPNHPSVAICLNKLGFINYKKGNYKKGENQIRQSMQIIEKSIGTKNLTYSSDLLILSFIKSALNDYDSVAILNKEVLKAAAESMGTDKSPFMAGCYRGIAEIALKENKYKKADSLYNLSLNMYKEIIGENNLSTINTNYDYCKLLLKMDSINKAYEIVQDNLEILSKNFNEDIWGIAEGKSLLGEIYMKRKEFIKAENLLLESLSSYKKEFGENDFHTKEVVQKLVSLYSNWNKKGKAEYYLSILK